MYQDIKLSTWIFCNINSLTPVYIRVSANKHTLVTEGKDPIAIKREFNHSGLYSVILVVCRECDKQFPIKTSEKQSKGLYDINAQAV